MSHGSFHVHGPHDHELEHATNHLDSAGWTKQIAIFTAMISTVGAFFSYMGGATQANATINKNVAAIKKTEASNQWSYYQAKSNKQNLSELALVLAPETKHAFYQAEIKRYQAEKEEIKKNADALEQESLAWERKSDAELHLHHRWAQATTALQASIAVAAIALISKSQWLRYAMYALGSIGLVIGVFASLHI